MAGPNTGLSPNSVKSGLDEVFYTEFDYAEAPGVATATDPIFFRQKSTQLGAVQTEEFLPPGEWETHQEEEEVRISTVRTGNKATHTVVNYKKALKIPVEDWEDEYLDVVDNAIERMGMRARTTRDKTALQSYPNGFSSFNTNAGTDLWSNSHTNLNGDTIDNLETGTLTPGNVEILFRSLMEQKAQDGEGAGHQPAGVLVPPILFPDLNEILDSELKPGTAQNELNYFSHVYPGLQPRQSIWIGAAYSSATNANTSYYVVSRNHSITRWERIGMATSLTDYTFDDQDRYTYKGRYREVYAAIGYEGAAAANGSV